MKFSQTLELHFTPSNPPTHQIWGCPEGGTSHFGKRCRDSSEAITDIGRHCLLLTAKAIGHGVANAGDSPSQLYVLLVSGLATCDQLVALSNLLGAINSFIAYFFSVCFYSLKNAINNV